MTRVQQQYHLVSRMAGRTTSVEPWIQVTNSRVSEKPRVLWQLPVCARITQAFCCTYTSASVWFTPNIMDSLLDFDQEYLDAPWGPYGRDLTLGIVSLASKFILQVLNSTKVLNHDTYKDLVHNRPEGLGLLTISNHTRWVTGCSTFCAAAAAVVVIQQSTINCDGCADCGRCHDVETIRLCYFSWLEAAACQGQHAGATHSTALCTCLL
jgi:hypothetical protein